jgi:TRAP-type C4-dicarboxylate transport system permease small subunit
MLRINGVVAVLLFAALTGVVSLQVLNRLVLHQSFIWSEEAARFLFLWVVLLGAAFSVRRRRHFVLDVLPRRPGKITGAPRFLFTVFPDACVLGFAVFLLVQAITYTRAGSFRTASNSGINMAVVYAAILVFAGLTIAYSVRNLLEDVRAFRAGRPLDRRAPPAE